MSNVKCLLGTCCKCNGPTPSTFYGVLPFCSNLKERIVPTHFIESYFHRTTLNTEQLCSHGPVFLYTEEGVDEVATKTSQINNMETIAIFKIKMK